MTRLASVNGTRRPSADRFFAGLDLGQASDYTALAILQRRQRTLSDPTDFRPAYTLRYCSRFPLHTPYPSIVDQVSKLLTRPEVPGVALAVDQTGVGRAVVDLFRVTGKPLAVTITGGNAVTWDAEDQGWKVPKKVLVSVLQLLFQANPNSGGPGRLVIPRNLPDAGKLVQELRAFRVKVKLATGNETFEAWRERDHDDLVLAVALAAWAGERALASEQPIHGR